MEETTRLVGRYQLVQELGEAPDGPTYLAVERGALGLTRLVVVKTVTEAELRDGSRAQSLRQRALLVAAIAHPNLVPLRAMVLDGQQLYLVSDFIPSIDLDGLLYHCLQQRKRGVPLSVALSIAMGSCAGGQALYNGTKDPLTSPWLNTTWRPRNVLVTFGGAVLIANAARAISLRDLQQPPEKTPLQFLSPEATAKGLAHLGGEADIRSEVFSVAATLHFMLALRHPFETSVAGRAINQQATPLSQHGVQVPTRLQKLLVAALAPQPQDRPSSLDELRSELAAVQLQQPYEMPRQDAVARWVAEICGVERLKAQDDALRQLVGLPVAENPHRIEGANPRADKTIKTEALPPPRDTGPQAPNADQDVTSQSTTLRPTDTAVGDEPAGFEEEEETVPGVPEDVLDSLLPQNRPEAPHTDEYTLSAGDDALESTAQRIASHGREPFGSSLSNPNSAVQTAQTLLRADGKDLKFVESGTNVLSMADVVDQRALETDDEAPVPPPLPSDGEPSTVEATPTMPQSPRAKMKDGEQWSEAPTRVAFAKEPSSQGDKDGDEPASK